MVTVFQPRLFLNRHPAWLSLLFLILLQISIVNAQDQDSLFFVDVTPKAGTTDESYVFSVAVDSRLSNEAPLLVGGDDFQVQLAGESSVQIIRGREIISQTNYNYRLIPKREGLLETPSAELESGGQKYTAGPLKVKVDKGLSPALSESDEAVFLRQTASPTKAYLGQQIVHSLNLYHQVSIHKPQFSDLTFDGFWNEDLGKPVESRAELNGKSYRLIRFEKALFPQRSGTIEIPPATMTGLVQELPRSRAFPFGRIDPRDPAFDAFFGNLGVKERTFSSNPSTVEILELPSAPSDLPGWSPLTPLVGETSLKLNFDSSSIASGESKTVTVEVISVGNLNPLQALPITDSPDYKVYTDEVQTGKDRVASRLQTRKIFRFSLVPLKPGELNLPPFKVAYFDSELKEYKIAASSAVSFNVTGQDLRVQNTKPDLGITQAPQDDYNQVTPYKAPTLMEEISEKLSLSVSLLLCTLLILTTGVVLYIAKIRTGAAPIKEIWRTMENAGTPNTLLHSVEQLIDRKLGDTARPNRAINVRSLLEERVTDQETRAAILLLLDRLEGLSFSGQKVDPSELSALRSRAKSILSSL